MVGMNWGMDRAATLVLRPGVELGITESPKQMVTGPKIPLIQPRNLHHKKA